MPVPSMSQSPSKANGFDMKRRKNSQKKGPAALQREKANRRRGEAQKMQALDEAARDFVTTNSISSFSGLPISEETKKGLKKASYVKMTDIQSGSIPACLKGHDVLGAARTGSGKTLAFLIPILEILYRRKWGPQDGLGALIISPTRELAVQIFDVLRNIGGYHSFSAGLVIGGKNLKDERDRLARMNILVSTPGRLLQHMDQTVGFVCDNLQILVLDEADRILDMGFARSLNAIISHLPKSRQTLLFSATQTQSVKDLARLSLKDPEFIGVQEKDSEGATPKNLEQHYLVCELDKKLDVLFSFIKSHLQVKVLVFMSSGKQVRFIFETFCKLHPGIPLLHLFGKQKQAKRLDIFQKFTTMKHAFLFATDIAARGLDFPSVDWVVQVDAPEDAETYIHRVGRTARYESKGQSLLFLLPSEEEGMAKALASRNVPIEKIKVKESKTMSIQNQLQSFAFQEPEIKYLAQRAFVSYVRSVYLQKDKDIFKVADLPIERFAAALGLPGAPKVKFVGREIAKGKKNAARAAALAKAEEERLGSSSDEEESDVEPDISDVKAEGSSKGVRTKYDRMFERKNQSVLSEHYGKHLDHSIPEDEDEDFFSLKRIDHALDDGAGSPQTNAVSKRQIKIGESKKAMAKYQSKGTKLVFDDDGEAHQLYEVKDDEEFRKGDVREAGRQFVEQERGKLKDADVVDKELARDKRKEKKRKRKAKQHAEGDGDVEGPTIAPLSHDDGYQSPEFDLPGSEEDYRPVTKRPKTSDLLEPHRSLGTLEADEELALKMLRRRARP